MRTYLLILILCSSNTFFSQTKEEIEQVLSHAETHEDLDLIQNQNASWEISISKTPEIGIHADSSISNSAIGSFVIQERKHDGARFYHKILSKETVEVCKVNYIFLDGKNRNADKIKSIQKMIISKYNDGTSFKKLHQMFNEDGNPNGELDWFYEGMMVQAFDEAVRYKKANTVFLVNIPEYHWYYVVFKEEENKMIDLTTSIKVLLAE